MKVYQIQIKTYRGDFVDYIGTKVFTGPYHDRNAANAAMVRLQEITRGNHHNYRVDARDAQGNDTATRLAA